MAVIVSRWKGTPFGRYQLIELLGRGGMGEVWRAYDTAIDRIVALKMLLPHCAKDPDFDKRFRREARAAARLDDPPRRADLRRRRDRRTAVCDHAADHRHRPANPARRRPAGPARAVDDHRADRLSAAQRPPSGPGTPRRQTIQHPARRERLRLPHRLRDRPRRGRFGVDAERVDHRHVGLHGSRTLQQPGEIHPSSDIYALACVLYECLTGQQPFPGNTLEQVASGHIFTPPPRALREERYRSDRAWTR